MTSDRLRQALSRYFDGESPVSETAEVERALATSGEARHYMADLAALRSRLGEDDSQPPPDVAGRVLAAIGQESRPVTRLRIAAAFVAGVFGGVVFIGLALRQPVPVATADIPERVLAAQGDVTSLTARIEIIERGLHPEVEERTYTGSISYQAPESLWVEIIDTTRYPSASWVPNHTTYVVDEEMAWSSSVAACPTEALPTCTPSRPRVSVLTNREPFPDMAPAPLDLIVPATSFSRAEEPAHLGFAVIDQRRAVGVQVTAAQVAALLDGLTGAGNWRQVHPTDRVELWLDEDALVPLAFSVFPAATPDRELWAINRGYRDSPEVPILEARWTAVSIGDPESIVFPTAAGVPVETDAGFRDDTPVDLEDLTPQELPDGMTLHRSGTIGSGSQPLVHVAAWSDGRRWLKLRWTHDWQRTRLFGDLGGLVRETTVESGVVYLNERGDRIALHSDHTDLIVTGSLPTEDLLDIVAGIDLAGLAIPENWAESATASVEDARSVVDGLLLPTGLEGFEGPAVHIEPGLAILAYAGPGNRAFLLTQAVNDELSPPLDAKVRGVTVRGLEGRYIPERGLLEWVEGNLTIGLASVTLSQEELVAVAESLRQP